MFIYRYLVIALSVGVLTGFLSIHNELYCQKTAGVSHIENNKFSIDNPFVINLELGIDQFIKNRDKDKKIPAALSYKLHDGSRVRRPVEIEPRGHFRRDNCYIPPIKIDFKDTLYRVDEFDRLGEVKLVLPCRDNKKFEQYLIKEYLAYKAYELISDYSLATFFLKINFIDTDKQRKPITNYAFMIEDIDKMARMHGGVEIEPEEVSPSDLDHPELNKITLFQYMIGNTDWSIPNLHNLKLISIDHPAWPKPVPVPYDFDFSGIVNPYYAAPAESLPIEKVTERYYIGLCMDKRDFESVKMIFLSHRQEILTLFSKCSLLTKQNRETSTDFLEDFFKIITDEDLTENLLFDRCK